MKFENTEVWGFEHALRGMRNPMNSWSKSDSEYVPTNEFQDGYRVMKYHIGENDLELAQKLIKAGEPHRKFLRQIFVSVDITAPIYWWKEFDTYKVGTVANSTSTMHKLASTPITKECFEMDDFEDVYSDKALKEATLTSWWNLMIEELEQLRQLHNKNMELSKTPNITDQEKRRLIIIAKKYWKELIRLLPESWLQTRTVTMNYENILNMVKYRSGHKLSEWSKSFIDWAKSLPYAGEMLFLI